jgi:predicted MFS family arabinose efflux permease
MSVYALNGLFFSFLIGRQIGKSKDRFYILLGLHCMLLGNLISLFRPEAGWYMLVGRSLEGMAYSILAITGPVLANRHTPDGYKPLVVSLIALWIPLGQVAATIIAPFVLEYFSWQGMWWVGIFITLIMIIWTFLIPTLALQGQTESYKTGPVDLLDNTQKRLLWLAALVFMLWSTQYFAFMTWLPVYFIEQLGFSLGESLMGYVWPIIIIIIFNLLTGVALRKGIPVGTLLVIGLTIQAAVWWLIPLTQVNVTGILALGFYGMAAGIIATCLFALPGTVTGRSGSAAIAFGFIMTGRNLGVFIGPILLGQWYLYMTGWDHVTPVFAGVTTLAVGAGWLLSRRLSSD